MTATGQPADQLVERTRDGERQVTCLALNPDHHETLCALPGDRRAWVRDRRLRPLETK